VTAETGYAALHGTGPMAEPARDQLLKLALAHLARHDVGTGLRSEGTPRCLLPGGHCKALAYAQVLAEMLWARSDDLHSAPAIALRRALAEVQSALRKFDAACGDYSAARAHLHAPGCVCPKYGHARFCLPFQKLLPSLVRDWRTRLAIVDCFALLPQVSDDKLNGDRHGRLKRLEAILDEQGCTLDEILSVLDDNHPGTQTVTQRKGRLRHRLAHYRAKRERSAAQEV
jgi:hypothetical protein